mgnify:CR=1 FL=1|tara:strand:+ start:4770 stop:5921 length:1152 start_codon:yes stop_codon:yes gene_type:complete
MATTRTDFGEPILNLQRIIQYVSDNVACKTIKLSIQTFSSVEKFVFINEPEVGTTNTFRFEVNRPVSSLLISDFPELLNLATALSGSKFLSSDIYVFVSSELDSNGNVLEATPFFFQTHYPYNFFRGQLLANFNPDSSGSTAIKFLTNAPNLRRLKRGDFVWLYGNDASYGPTNAPLQEWVIQDLDSGDNILATSTIDYVNKTQTGAIKAGGVGYPIEISSTETTSVSTLVFIRDKASPFTVRSEIKRFNEYTKDCGDYRLFWLNQYNATESIYLTGNKQRQIENNKQTFTQSEPVNANYNEGGIKSYANNFRYSYTLNTGRATPQEIKYFSEILYSRKTALLVDGVLIEVVLTDSDLRDFDEKDSVDNITFNFTEARQNTFL